MPLHPDPTPWHAERATRAATAQAPAIREAPARVLHPVALPPLGPDDDDDDDLAAPILTTGQELVYVYEDAAFVHLIHGRGSLAAEHDHIWHTLPTLHHKPGRNGERIYFTVDVCIRPYKAHHRYRNEVIDVCCEAQRWVMMR